MKSERSRKWRLSGLLLAAATIIGCGLTVAACSNGGEGDRCNYLGDNNGDDDCQDGLICWQQSQLSNANSDLCCPPDRANATTAACAIAQTTLDAAVPVDSGGGDAPIDTNVADSDASDAPIDTNAGDTNSGDTGTGDAATPDGDDGG